MKDHAPLRFSIYEVHEDLAAFFAVRFVRGDRDLDPLTLLRLAGDVWKMREVWDKEGGGVMSLAYNLIKSAYDLFSDTPGNNGKCRCNSQICESADNASRYYKERSRI